MENGRLCYSVTVCLLQPTEWIRTHWIENRQQELRPSTIANPPCADGTHSSGLSWRRRYYLPACSVCSFIFICMVAQQLIHQNINSVCLSVCFLSCAVLRCPLVRPSDHASDESTRKAKPKFSLDLQEIIEKYFIKFMTILKSNPTSQSHKVFHFAPV